jgi:penicillin-binding protein 2
VSTTRVPDARAIARAYLDAWKAEDYDAMYALLTGLSQDAISREKFEKHYRGVATEMALSGVDYEIISSLVQNPTSAQVGYRVTFHSTLVGDLQRETVMNLSLEQGQWRVKWDDTLVMPELAGGNYLGMERYIPARANIYDRNGHALVAQADATAIGLIPGQIDPEQEEALFTWLVRLTGLSADAIRARYENFPPAVDWYLPLGEVPAEMVSKYMDILSGFSGLVLQPYKARYYFDGGIAAHVVGYVTTIQAGQEEAYLRRGYSLDERVGQAGLEKWGEPYLSGTRGGALYVFNSQGQIVTRLAEKPAQPAQAIYTTLDRDFQREVERALSGFRGAVVVLERDTGRVLAMASSPDFDPNAFEPVNRNSSYLLQEIFSDPATPTFNRATQGQYPPGSIFKLVTIAAALESGLYTPETTYQCGYFFTEVQGLTLNDWTYDHYLEDGKTAPSGLLTLPQGLIRSCNPFFWHIGLDLYRQGKTTAIADMARGYGLGSPTGIIGLDEAAGNVPLPENEVDAVNLAIGQGKMLVTPLQVANFVAALGNGGTLYRPQVVERIAPPDGEATFTFKPEVIGKLPVSPESLKVIQEAMRGVVASTQPRGTAWHRFTGLDILVAGKTGTAQSGSGQPHAWFAGYTFEGRADKPDIAAAVIVENVGEGSDYAAPIFRRIVEIYFYGRPTKLYPWESGFYITPTPTPTPEVVETPQP